MSNLTNNLYDDISDLSEEDSYMCYKNLLKPSVGPVPVFKKPKQKLFLRNPSSIQRIRRSEILRLIDIPKKNKLVCSTPMNPLIASRAGSKHLPLSPITLSENRLSRKSQDTKTSQKNSVNTIVKSMITHLHNLSTNNTTQNENNAIKPTTETTTKVSIDVQTEEIDENCPTKVPEAPFESIRNTQFRRLMLERQTQTTDSLQRISDPIQEPNKGEIVKENIEEPLEETLKPTDQVPLDVVQTSNNQCLTNDTNNEAVIDQFVENLYSSTAHINPTVISISSESSVSDTILNMSLVKNVNNKTFTKINDIGEDDISAIKQNHISSQGKNTKKKENEIKTKQDPKESDSNKSKTKRNASNNSKNKHADQSSEINDLNMATINSQHIDSIDNFNSVDQNKTENVDNTNRKREQKRNSKKTSTIKHTEEENKKKAKSLDITFTIKQRSRRKSTLNDKSTNKKSTKRANSIRKTISLQQYLVCRKSGFVEVCENDTSNSTDDSFTGERPRRKRKPPKAFIQATLFSAGSLRRKTKEKSSYSNESKPSRSGRCTTVSQNKSGKEMAQTSNNPDENTLTISSIQVADSTEKTVVASEISSEHIFKKPRLQPKTVKKRTTKRGTQVSESRVEVENNSIEQGSSINTYESIDSGSSTISKDVDCHIHDIAILPEIQEIYTPDSSLENKKNTDNCGSKQTIENLNEDDAQMCDVQDTNVSHSEDLPVQVAEVETIATSTIVNSEERSKIVTRKSNQCVIISNICLTQTDLNTDVRLNVNKPSRKSVTFVDYPEECRENREKSVVLYNENENARENAVTNVDSSSKNVIYTIIDNKAVPIDWCSKAPSSSLTTNKAVKVDYCLKNLRTHFGTASYGFLTFGPGESKLQTSMHYSITYKVEKGQAVVSIHLQEQVMDVNCCFHIPMGSTYCITNLSKNEPLVLFFHKNSAT